MRMEPPASVPMCSGPKHAAPAAPAPEELPPVVCAGFHGLRVMPCSGQSPGVFHPNSVVVVLPRITHPAARNPATSVTGTGFAFPSYDQVWAAMDGDLGAFIDGELVITGRMKDLVVIAGRNHYPQDIEYTVFLATSHIPKGMAAAFAIPGEPSEKLVILAERDDCRIQRELDEARRQREAGEGAS